MSNERTSSAVRNLRTIFENKATENAAHDLRGRSPGGISKSERENSRPQSKIRASFVPVDLAAGMAELLGDESGRRGSFVEGESGGPLTNAKIAIGQTKEERMQDVGADEAVPETAIESAAPTPGINTSAQLGQDEGEAKASTEAQSVDENAGKKNPLATAARVVKKTADKVAAKAGVTTSNHRTSLGSSRTSTAASPKAESSRFTTQPVKSSRSSLTAPTAASAARAAAASEKSPTDSSPARTRVRESTRPLEVSASLTAPTAASKAKSEPERVASGRPSLGRAIKPTPSVRPTPRQSLAAGQRPGSSASQNSGTKKAVVADSGFAERMSRPTAASQNRLTDKTTDVKPTPKPRAAAPKPKVNGAVKSGVASNSPVATVIPGETNLHPAADDSVLQTHPVPEVAPSTAGAVDEPVVKQDAELEEDHSTAVAEPEAAQQPAVVSQVELEPPVAKDAQSEPVAEPEPQSEVTTAKETEPTSVPEPAKVVEETKLEPVAEPVPTSTTEAEPESHLTHPASLPDIVEPAASEPAEPTTRDVAESALAAPEDSEHEASAAVTSVADPAEESTVRPEMTAETNDIPPLDGPTAEALAATPAFGDSETH